MLNFNQSSDLFENVCCYEVISNCGRWDVTVRQGVAMCGESDGSWSGFISRTTLGNLQ